MLVSKVQPLAQNNSNNTSTVLSGQNQQINLNGRRVSAGNLNMIPTNISPKSPSESPVSNPLSAFSQSGPSSMDKDKKAIDRVELEAIKSITDISQDNEKRRTFFFQLKEALAQKIKAEMHPWIGNSTTVLINGDNYDARTLEENSDNKLFCLSNVLTLGLPYLCCLASDTLCGSDEIPPKTNYFATRIALALVYIYQDHIPILTPGSYKNLIDFFVAIVELYCFPGEHRRSPDDSVHFDDKPSDFKSSDIYSILMSSLNIRELPGMSFRLNTVNGLEFSIQYLFSTGIRIGDENTLEPFHPESKQLFEEMKRRGDFPLYRWGTMDVYHSKNLSYDYYGNKSNMKDNDFRIGEGKPQTNGDINTTTNKTVFWQKVEELAHHYLSQQELAQAFFNSRR